MTSLEGEQNIGVLLYVLENSVKEAESSLNGMEKGGGKTEQEARLKSMKAFLKKEQSPLMSSREVQTAIGDIESFAWNVKKLNDGSFDEVSINDLLNSELSVFFDSSETEKLIYSQDSASLIDRIFSTLGPEEDEIKKQAEVEWGKNVTAIEELISERRGEITDIEIQMGQTGNRRQKRQLKRKLKLLKQEILTLQAEAKTGMKKWTDRKRTETENTQSKGIKFTHTLSTSQLRKIQDMADELRNSKIERIYLFMEANLTEANLEFERAKDKGIFSNDTIEQFEAESAEAESFIKSRSVSSLKKLGEIAKEFELKKDQVSKAAEEMLEIQNNRSVYEEKIRSMQGHIMSVIQKAPELTDKLRQKLLDEASGNGKPPENSAILRKQLKGLDTLEGKNLGGAIAELEKDVANMSNMFPEELQLLMQNLEQFETKLPQPENFKTELETALTPEGEAAAIAGRTLDQIDSAATIDEIQIILENNLGKEHLEIVQPAEFESRYRKYTEEGQMVFYNHKTDWRVILSETALDNPDPKVVEKIKKQVTHELLHLEFENAPGFRDGFINEIVKAMPEQWMQVRQAFDAKVKANGKMPPHGDEWTDDMVASEVYAMMNETGAHLTKGSPEAINLNEVLVATGIAEKIKNMRSKTRQYRENSDVGEILGYESGVEAGEEGGDVSKSISAVETKTRGTAIYEKNESQINILRTRISDIQKSNFLGAISGAKGLVNAMSDFNEGTAELNAALKREPDSEIISSSIDSRIHQLTNDLSSVEDAIGKEAAQSDNTDIGLLRNLWNSTNFLSIADFVQMGVDAKEFFERRHKRKKAENAARIGMAFFSGTSLGREAKARKEKAEAEEVQEWKSRYENLDGWELLGELKSISKSVFPNSDQLKAILRILADKGRIDWQNKDLWLVLNKLQNAAYFKPGDSLLLHNPILLREKLHKALGEIYDYDEFLTLERTNESSFESEKKKNDPIHDRTQTKLTERLDELLIQHQRGERVDPILYESIIDYCIGSGKSYAENVMFHLISGMATGLLPSDRGLGLGKHINVWPPIEWFSSLKPPYTQKDWHNLCMRHFSTSFKNRTISDANQGLDFKNWFWTEVQNNKMVQDRVKKSVGERSWDHDWGRSIACLGDADTAKRFLAGRSGQQETKVTAIGNAYAGTLQWLEENSKTPGKAGKNDFARMAGFIAMSEGILNGTAFHRGANDINTRENDTMNESIPREAGIGRHFDKNVTFHRKQSYNFLMEIDPEFFGFLEGKEARDEIEKKDLGGQAVNILSKYEGLRETLSDLQSIDQIYDKMDLIIRHMFDIMEESEFQRILKVTAPVK